MKHASFLISLSLVFGLPTIASAQTLDVPIVMDCVDNESGCYATSRVQGLDPNGDGFLAVRRGPGTQHAMFDKLYNGDVVAVVNGYHRPWVGVSYGNGKLGWVHSRWLVDLAG